MIVISFLLVGSAICSVCFLGVVLKVIKNYHRIFKLKKLLPHFRSVPSWPLIGSALLFETSSSDGMLRSMEKFHLQFGKNLILQELGNEFKLLTTDPRVIEQVILARTVSKAKMYTFLQPFIGRSSVVLSGAEWTTRRKIVSPGFHYGMLEDFLLTMVSQSEVLVDKLNKHVGGSDFDVYGPLRFCTMDIICETALGIQLHCQANPNEEFTEATEEMLNLAYKRFFNPMISNDLIFSLTEAGRRQQRMLKVIHNFVDAVIRDRKQRLLDTAQGQSNKMTFLDLLLQSHTDGKPLLDEEIRGEVNTFMFAGHETITSCVSFALYYLSRYPTVQQKLYDEIISVYGAEEDVRSAQITYGSLQQLHYMEMVVKESLRIGPPAPLIGRRSAGDMVIDGVQIPAGTEVIINIYVMHNDTSQFSDPERFIPERFEDESGRSPFGYLPFSVGLRSCIGQRFAMLEIKTLLVKLMANYRFVPCEKKNELQFKSDITLKPLRGAFIKILKR